MNYLVSLLLIFSDEECAFQLFAHLVENIFPNKLYQKSGKGCGLFGLLSETYVLQKLLETQY